MLKNQFKTEARRDWPLMLLVSLCLVVDAFSEVPEGESLEKLRQERLEKTIQLIDAVSLARADNAERELSRSEYPLLRYTNPVTSSFAEGTLFLWLEQKRPVAAVSVSFRDTGEIWWELSSLCDASLILDRDGRELWRPTQCGRKSEMVPDAPAPADSATVRLTQMRALARRFNVREERRGQWQDARLLSQPLYRWEATEQGVLDGALFGYTETTDPEVMLLLEARQNTATKGSQWYYSLAKMTSSPVAVSLDEKQIWSVPGYWKNPRTRLDPYIEEIIVPK